MKPIFGIDTNVSLMYLVYTYSHIHGRNRGGKFLYYKEEDFFVSPFLGKSLVLSI